MTDSKLLHQTLGRYQLLVAVARGGMGQVWLARLKGARGFHKLVAIKTLLPHEQDLPRLERMLAEEARIASLVQHPNVVRTIELGEHEGLLYLVMEWVEGEPLGFLLERAAARGGMSRSVAVGLVAQVLNGLHAAHELADHTGPLGVVHRDVSPHNILVTYEGLAKLLDFGIAKATQQASSSTETGEIKGKFSYMAPEQILSGSVDRRCDVFATGIVLYLLTTGRHPFKHHNTAAVIHAITTDEPVTPPSAFLDDYPGELEAVLLKALEKDRERRWASAEEMLRALEQALPEAFGDTGRLELQGFMERVAGDRKLARKEAVRRAQLAADTTDVDVAALQFAASQSASSLRAISISGPPGEDSRPSEHSGSEERTRVAPQVKRSAKGPWFAAAAGCALLLAALLSRELGRQGVDAPHGASAAPARGAELVTPPAPARSEPAPRAASAQPTAESPSSELEPTSPARAAASPGAAPVPSDAPAPHPAKAPAARVVPKRPAAAAEQPARSTDDLLPPEYAR